MELMEFERRVNLIKEVHNEIRENLYKVYKEPDARAYYINENTILRFAALLEHPDFKGRLKPKGITIEERNNGEVIVRTLLYFRDLILNNKGKFKMLPEDNEDGEHVRAVKKFLTGYKEYKVKEGEPLPILEVPMIHIVSFSFKKWFLSKMQKLGLLV